MERDYYNEGWIDGYKRGADDERPKAFSDGYEKGYQKGKADAIWEILQLPKHNHYDNYGELMYQSIDVKDIEQVKEQK